jgi:hypothetical protein
MKPIDLGKSRKNHRPTSHLVILGICVWSVLLCVLADPVIFAESYEIGVSEVIPRHDHFDEHEEGFVLTKPASVNKQPAVNLAKAATHLSGSSHNPSPITPPPRYL